jgi:hypothetical protein
MIPKLHATTLNYSFLIPTVIRRREKIDVDTKKKAKVNNAGEGHETLSVLRFAAGDSFCVEKSEASMGTRKV